jgi:serine/threonine-protein kinase
MPWQVGDYVADGDKPFDHGSFGTLWHARRLSDGARVALKLVLLTSSADSREKLAAERSGAMLQQRFEQAHGMVPKVYDYGQDGDDLYIAMELIEGGALADLIQRGPLAPRLAAEYAVRICEFLDKAHRFATTIEHEAYEGVVHADLKPAHVLIPRSGGIKVLDFGIAKALAKTTQVTTDNWGTLHYASPERLESGQVNEYVDFWSLGVMLYEMVSGYRPYWRLEGHRNLHERAIRSNEAREPLPPSCPPDLAAIINKLLAYQIERRYPDAAAIKSDLELFLSDRVPIATGEYATQPTLPIRPERPRPATQRVVTAAPPTDPLPIAASGGVAVVDSVTPSTGSRSIVRRIASTAVLLAVIGLIAAEGVAWVAAEQFRGEIDALDGRSVAQKKQEYDRIRGWSLLDLGVHLRVNGRLEARLVALADSVIADYRREEPTVGPVDWRQADDALRWALEFSPHDSRLLAKELVCDAHLTRVTAQKQPRGGQLAHQTYLTAIGKFRRAAELDTKSFDPYLGISRVEVYGLENVDEAGAAIAEAQQRGYRPGQRERAQVGDGYLQRAEKSRKLARTLSGEQRRRELEKAGADYGRCIESFDPIVGFARAAQNLEFCKRRLEAVGRELTADGEKP